MFADNDFKATENITKGSLKTADHPEFIAAMNSGRLSADGARNTGNQKVDWLPDVFFTNEQSLATPDGGKNTAPESREASKQPTQEAVKPSSFEGQAGNQSDANYKITDGDRIGEQGAGGKPELKLPDLDEIRKSTPEQLRAIYEHNSEIVQDYLRSQLPNLPGVIGFHGGTRESNDLWIGTGGERVMPPQAAKESAGNKSDYTWVELISTATEDMAALADGIGHAFRSADGFANPHWIDGPFTPGGVSIIDLSDAIARNRVGEREQHLGLVEKGRMNTGWNRDFGRIYKGTIDYGDFGQYRDFVNNPNEDYLKRLYAGDFLKQEMAMATIGLLSGREKPSELGRQALPAGSELPPIVDDTKPAHKSEEALVRKQAQNERGQLW